MSPWDGIVNYPGVARGAGRLEVGEPVQGGEKARRRRLQRRLVVDGERTYTAYSADELIEIDSIAHHGRPGLPY